MPSWVECSQRLYGCICNVYTLLGQVRVRGFSPELECFWLYGMNK